MGEEVPPAADIPPLVTVPWNSAIDGSNSTFAADVLDVFPFPPSPVLDDTVTTTEAGAEGYTTAFSTSTALSWALVSLLVPVGLAAAVLNSLVLSALRLNPALRTPLDFVIAGLAVVDLLTGVVGVPIIIVLYTPDLFMSEPPAYWKINLLWSAFNVLNLLSVWHVLAVTLDRHWAVQRPARYLRAQEYLRRRPRLLPGAAAAAWATAAAFCFVPSLFLFVWGEDIADESTLTVLKHLDTAMLIFVDQLLPLAVVTVLNARLFLFIRDHKAVERWALQNDIGLLYGKTVNSIRMSCLVSAFLLATYLPYLVKWWIEVASQVSPPEYAVSPEACLVIQFVQSLNCVINPVIYAFQMPAYSYGYRRCGQFFKGCCCDCCIKGGRSKI